MRDDGGDGEQSTWGQTQGPVTVAEVKHRLETILDRTLDTRLFSAVHAIDDAEGAARLLRGLIQTQGLRTGDEIPAGVFAHALALHRNTMNKALNLLAGEGYLRRRHGRPACVVSNRPRWPERAVPMISYTQTARDSHLDICNEVIVYEEGPLGRVVEEDRRDRVRRYLELGDEEPLVVLSRIRKMRGEGMAWAPALAEMAYFAVERLPPLPERQALESGRAQSIRDFLRSNGVDVVNSAYRIRIADLPEVFHASWMRAAAIDEAAVKALRFLRFESTTHSELGPVEFSVAYLMEAVFAVSTSDLEVKVEIREKVWPSHPAMPSPLVPPPATARRRSTSRQATKGRERLR